MEEDIIMPRRGLARNYAQQMLAHWDVYDKTAYLRAYPDISDRARWDALPEELRQMLIAEGEKYLFYQWPQIVAADYMEFSENGNRSHFQDKQFARRTSLNALVLAECVENKGRFMQQILNGLFLMLEESTWCLPAHNAYIRDTKQFPLPDYDRPVIDLFQAESASIAAVAEYLLRPKFAQICPFISKDVNNRLRERIFVPYLNAHFWWMGNGKEPVNNWTVWCTQNVLLSAFTREPGLLDAETRRQILEKAVRSIDYFLDEYGEDGCCDEGAQYYSHAGLTLFNCLEILKELSNGGSAGIFSEPLIKNIADYILKVYVGNGYYINFADCSPRAGRRGAREFLFGKATGNRAMEAFAAQDYRESDDKLITDEHNLYYRLQQAFAHAEMMQFPAKPEGNTAVSGETSEQEQNAAAEEKSIQPEKRTASGTQPAHAADVWFESVGLMVARDGVYTLAAKAGDNADSHNHNDVGSFTIYKNSEPLLIDLGVETYTEKTFSPRRYEIWTMQSQYHNLPSFGSTEQVRALFADAAPLTQPLSDFAQEHDGAAFAAKNVTCTLTEKASSLRMDIADAYPAEQVCGYVREAVLEKGKGIRITDHYEGGLACVLSLMTYETPVLKSLDTEKDIAVLQVGAANRTVNTAEKTAKNTTASAVLTIKGAGAVRIETCPITDERLQTAWKHDCYRVLVEMKDKELELEIV